MPTKKAIHQFSLATITLLGAGYLHVADAEPEPGKPLTKTPLDENKNKTTKYVTVWNKWQKNIVHFNGMPFTFGIKEVQCHSSQHPAS